MEPLLTKMGSIWKYFRISIALLFGGAFIYGGIYRYLMPTAHPLLDSHRTDGILTQIALGALIIFLQISYELSRQRRSLPCSAQSSPNGSRLGLGIGTVFTYFGHIAGICSLGWLLYWLIAQPRDGAYLGLAVIIGIVVMGAAYGIGGIIKQYTGN